MAEHKCEIPGWKCFGNGPIVLECLVVGSSWGDFVFEKTEVNYCPFCGYSLPMAGLKEKNELD